MPDSPTTQLTLAQVAELRHIARVRHSGVASNAANPRVAHVLVRSGHLTCFRNSDQVRGERRYHWWVFELTPKGRLALSGQETGVATAALDAGPAEPKLAEGGAA